MNQIVETLEECNFDLHRDQNLENRSTTAKQLQIAGAEKIKRQMEESVRI